MRLFSYLPSVVVTQIFRYAPCHGLTPDLLESGRAVLLGGARRQIFHFWMRFSNLVYYARGTPFTIPSRVDLRRLLHPSYVKNSLDPREDYYVRVSHYTETHDDERFPLRHKALVVDIRHGCLLLWVAYLKQGEYTYYGMYPRRPEPSQSSVGVSSDLTSGTGVASPRKVSIHDTKNFLGEMTLLNTCASTKERRSLVKNIYPNPIYRHTAELTRGKAIGELRKLLK